MGAQLETSVVVFVRFWARKYATLYTIPAVMQLCAREWVFHSFYKNALSGNSVFFLICGSLRGFAGVCGLFAGVLR